MHDRHGVFADELRRRVLDGPGSLEPAVRRSIAEGDADADELAAAGFTQDQMYEATISAALGAGIRRLDAGLRAIDASFQAHPDMPVALAPSRPTPMSIAEEPSPITIVIDSAAPPLVRRQPGVNIPGHSQ